MIRLAVLFGLGFAAFVASAVVGRLAMKQLRALEAGGAIRDVTPAEDAGADGWSVARRLWGVRVPLNRKEARRLVDLYRGLQALAVGLMLWGLLSV